MQIHTDGFAPQLRLDSRIFTSFNDYKTKETCFGVNVINQIAHKTTVNTVLYYTDRDDFTGFSFSSDGKFIESAICMGGSVNLNISR